MKKNLKIILGLSCLTFLFAGVACKQESKEQELQSKGYKICVSYDANGGSFLDRQGITVQDWFKPADYEKDENGEIHIQLLEPTDSTRPTSSSEKISLTKSNYFFAGWYATREVKEINGVPVDENGRELEAVDDGRYVYADPTEDEKEKTVTPAYVYSDYWDFENDTLDYAESDGFVSMTLYAGWVPYYEFHYYYQVNGEWTKLEEVTTFDYKTTNAVGSQKSDKDTIWLPTWKDGAMNHTFTYADSKKYNFPKIAGTTFDKAYLDAECQQPIEGESFEHLGSLDLETCTAVNRVQNIYITVTDGEQYRITEAKQLVDNADPQGIYEIQADLDFTDQLWPTAFETGTFEGKMYATEGQTYTLRNIQATHNSPTSTVGGLFGKIADGAEIKNLTFENATLNLAYTGERLRDTSFGLFAGIIEENATLENVTISGTLKFGTITLGEGYTINLYANGNTKGLTGGTVAIQIYGMDLYNGEYNYTILPYDKEDTEKKTVTVDATYNVSITLVTAEQFNQAIYSIDYVIENN